MCMAGSSSTVLASARTPAKEASAIHRLCRARLMASASHGARCLARCSATDPSADPRPCGEAPHTTRSRRRRSDAITPGAEVCVSRCWGTTCSSGPMASWQTAIHAIWPALPCSQCKPSAATMALLAASSRALRQAQTAAQNNLHELSTLQHSEDQGARGPQDRMTRGPQIQRTP